MVDHVVELCVPSLAATRRVATAVAESSRLGDVIVLSGEMGAGKTAFAQGFGAAWGVTVPITSPTFTLVHSYEVPERRATLHHADLYRLERTTEIADLSLLELSEDRGVLLVEWGEVAEQFLGDHLRVTLARDDTAPAKGAATGTGEFDFGLDEARRISLGAEGPSWSMRWPALTATLEDLRC